MTAPAPAPAGKIRVGVGGWTYEPWDESFYPPRLAKARQLQHAASVLTTIEINGTYYRTQTPATFAKWAADTPEDFVFAVKALRYTTNRRVLAEAGESITRFCGGGIAELGPKLGPIVWQFATTKAFDPDDFGAFLALLPTSAGGLPPRHVMDVRHPSFKHPDYLALAARHHVATVFTDSDEHPSFADLTGDFVYARLMRCEAERPTGYAPEALDAWAARAADWARGRSPADLPHVAPPPASGPPREVFVFFINGAKERAPAAAQALITRLAR